MALEKMTENVEIVQTLSTYPNQEDGLSAEELKAKFDQGPKALKAYLNNVLVPAVQGILKAIDAGEQYGLDTTLSVPGRAADAGAVGTALAGKAPAGYGLGGGSPMISDLNNATNNGWYGCTGGTANVPPIQFTDYSVVLVLRRQSTDITQILFCNVLGGIQWIRHFYDGVWSAWECVNPPMIPGVEYRTTERWNGKAVYTMLIDFGALPNAATKVVENLIQYNVNAISITGYAIRGTGVIPLPHDNVTVTFNNEWSYPVVYSPDDMSGYHGYLTVRYTKN